MSVAVNHDTKIEADRFTDIPEARPRPRRLQWKAWLFKFITFPFLGVIYIALIAEGIKRFSAESARPLWRAIPVFGFLRNYEGWHRLETAHPLALIVLFGSAWACLSALRLLFPKRSEPVTPFGYRFTLGLAGVLLCADASFFYYSLQNGGVWGSGSIINFSAILMTVAYTAILVAWSLAAVRLED